MSAVRHSYTQPNPNYQPRSNPPSTRKVVKPNTTKSRSSTVKLTPRHQHSARLKNLQKLALATKITSLALVAVSAGLYAITYSAPQTWDNAQQELEQLQQQERQLTQLNESLKYDQAKQASSNSDLVVPNPQNSIFIKTTESESVELKKPQNQKINQPVGY